MKKIIVLVLALSLIALFSKWAFGHDGYGENIDQACVRSCLENGSTYGYCVKFCSF